MNLPESPELAASLNTLRACGLLTVPEIEEVSELRSPRSPLAQAVELSETVHLHIKVDDTHELPVNQFFDAGGRLDHQKDGFVKFRFPGGLNAIFSHIPVSQDELRETAATRRPRPFLDHIGIDLRDETATVRSAFDRLPDIAGSLEWSHASQGGDRPVYCCHVEVAEKHWLYPSDREGRAGIPLEFAYGALKGNPGKMGCDLRPSDPRTVDPASVSCCGTTEVADARPPASDGYYRRADLGRFGEITRVNPRLGEAFFAYYNDVMADGVLTKREKALIALALAHALKCPYCIDAYTGTLLGMSVSEAEMSEAVHVAGAISAGIALVHSVQMMGRLDAHGASSNDGHS